MILAGALTKMIDQAEVVLFLNTGNSLSFDEKTQSPWIYHELLTAKYIEKKIPDHVWRCEQRRKSMQSDLMHMITVEYDVDLSEFINLGVDQLREWEIRAKGAKKESALRILYKMFPLSDSSRRRERICFDARYIQEKACEAYRQNSHD
jgi:hypothetical protein